MVTNIQPPYCLKLHPHQQQCRSNIVQCYKTNDSFDKVECCFDIVAVFGNNVAAFGRFWQQCRTKFRPFDKVETNLTCLIQFEKTKFRLTLLLFWQQSRMLLWHCCWCGRSFRVGTHYPCSWAVVDMGTGIVCIGSREVYDRCSPVYTGIFVPLEGRCLRVSLDRHLALPTEHSCWKSIVVLCFCQHGPWNTVRCLHYPWTRAVSLDIRAHSPCSRVV